VPAPRENSLNGSTSCLEWSLTGTQEILRYVGVWFRSPNVGVGKSEMFSVVYHICTAVPTRLHSPDGGTLDAAFAKLLQQLFVVVVP